MKNCPRCHSIYPSHFSLCPRDGAPLVESGEWSDGIVIRGKYRIVGKVGQGGMGAVYKAHHVMFEELRALKVMNADLVRDDVFVKRFKQEAVIARKLHHPNAVRVDDIDEAEDGRPFIVMEYIEGVSLKRVIQEEGRIAPARVMRIAAQVAGALDAAHQLGMVHRDVKPANIVLVQGSQGEEAKVLDFGIAKLKEARAAGERGLTLTGTGMVVGTPQYMSPEQAAGKRGDQLDGRSDIYSLGVVMYQMLAGALPFTSDTTMGLLMAHINSPPRPLTEVNPGLILPAGFAQIVMQCLEKKPHMRPSSGAALIQNLESAKESATPEPPAALPAQTPVTDVTIQASALPESAPQQADMPAYSLSTGAAAGAEPGSAVTNEGTAEALPSASASHHTLRWIIAFIIVVAAIAAGYEAWRIRARSRTHASAPPKAVSMAAGSASAPSGKPQANLSSEGAHPPSGQGSGPEANTNGATQPQSKTEVAGQVAKNERIEVPAGTGKTGSGAGRSEEYGRPASERAREGRLRQDAGGALPAAPAAPGAGLADLVVITTPGAKVFMDGKQLGTVGKNGRLSVENVKAGAHHLRVSLAGFSDAEWVAHLDPGGTSLQMPQFGSSPTIRPAAAPVTHRAASSSVTDSNLPAVKPVMESFRVVHVHRFGSCKGTLIVRNDSIEYRADNGKDSFKTPLAGAIWRENGHDDVFLRLVDGRDYNFRTQSASAIIDAIREALGQVRATANQ